MMKKTFEKLGVVLTLAFAPHFSMGSQIYFSPEQETSTRLHFDESQAPILEYVADQVQATEALNNFSKKAQPSSCKNCSISTATEIENDDSKSMPFRYQDSGKQCSSKNNYLEARLEKIKNSDTLFGQLVQANPSIPEVIKPQCLRIGMESKFGKNSRSFKSCGAQQGQVSSRSAYRPCMSDNYFNLVSNSFNLVSQCMRDYLGNASLEEQNKDVEAIYSMINIESGFHVNAMSHTGAGGIGQFTASAIKNVNSSQLLKMRNHLASSVDGQCRQLAEEFLNKPMATSYAKSCDRVSLEAGNPVKNMLYTYAYIKIAKSQIQTTILEKPSYRMKFDLSESEMKDVERALTVWAHNAGPAGTWTPTKMLLMTKYRKSKVTDSKKFIRELAEAMKNFPASANKSKARRIETARYLPAIQNHLADITESVGGGSCIN